MRERNIWGKQTVLLSASAILLLLSTAGSASAAFSCYSDYYGIQMKVAGIGVELLENGDRLAADGALLSGMTKEGEHLVLGKEYAEELSVRNTGEIDSYVRVILWKSWKDAKGAKNQKLSPDLIDLELNLSADGWVRDPSASTKERTVLYYKKALPGDPEQKGEGGVTPAFCSSICIDSSLRNYVREKVVSADANGNRTIQAEYEYDGYSFEVKAEVDAVQTHNAREAVKSAWGVDVRTASDGTLILSTGESVKPAGKQQEKRI